MTFKKISEAINFHSHTVGQLVSNGTPDDPILLRSKEEGKKWRGISFEQPLPGEKKHCSRHCNRIKASLCSNTPRKFQVVLELYDAEILGVMVSTRVCSPYGRWDRERRLGRVQLLWTVVHCL